MTDSNDTTEMPTNCTIIKAYRGYEFRGFIREYYPHTNTLMVTMSDKSRKQTYGHDMFIHPDMVIPDNEIEIRVIDVVPISELGIQWGGVRDE